MSRSISTIIPGGAGQGQWPTVSLLGRETLDSPPPSGGTEKGSLECGFQAGELCGAQLLDWGSNDGSGVWSSVKIIKSLGRWKSDAYQLYVRFPTDLLSSISKQLAQSRMWVMLQGTLPSLRLAA